MGVFVDVEIGVEFPVDDRELIAVELGIEPGGVVIGAHEPATVLDQIGAQQQAVPRPHHRRQHCEEFRAWLRRQVADRRPQEGEQPAPTFGNSGSVRLEIATDSGDFDTWVLGLDCGCGR